jgi:hypothetical protein
MSRGAAVSSAMISPSEDIVVAKLFSVQPTSPRRSVVGDCGIHSVAERMSTMGLSVAVPMAGPEREQNEFSWPGADWLL